MQVFKTFFKVAGRYKMLILLYFGISALMTAMVSSQYAKHAEKAKYGNVSYTIAVNDQDRSGLSKALVAYLKKQHTVQERAYTEEMAKDLLYYQELGAYITIPKGFEEAYASSSSRKIVSLSDEGQVAGSFIHMQMEQYLEGVNRFQSSGLSLEEAVNNSNKANDVSKFVVLQSDTGKKKNVNSKLYSLFLFLPYAVMAIMLSSVLPVLLVFEQPQVRARTIVSALSPTKRGISLIAGAVVIALLIFSGLLIFTSLFLKEELFSMQWLMAALNLLIFTMTAGAMLLPLTACSSLGILKAKDVITNIVALGFSFLGGIFVPLSVLGDSVKSVGRFLPTYWYATALSRIQSGENLHGLLGCFGLELAFGLICVAAGLAISQLLLEKKA